MDVDFQCRKKCLSFRYTEQYYSSFYNSQKQKQFLNQQSNIWLWPHKCKVRRTISFTCLCFGWFYNNNSFKDIFLYLPFLFLIGFLQFVIVWCVFTCIQKVNTKLILFSILPYMMFSNKMKLQTVIQCFYFQSKHYRTQWLSHISLVMNDSFFYFLKKWKEKPFQNDKS